MGREGREVWEGVKVFNIRLEKCHSYNIYIGMTKKISRRHHILPMIYQIRFSSNPEAKSPQVMVLDMKKGEWRTQAVRKTAVIKDYYSITTPEGNAKLDSDEVEKWLGYIEGAAAGILKSKIDRQRSLGREEKWILSLFIATLRMRTPFIRNRMGGFIEEVVGKVASMIHHRSTTDSGYFKKLIEDCKKATGEDVEGITPEDLDPKKYKIKPTKDFLIGLTFSHVIKMAHILASMRWKVYRAPTTMRFLTCDNPYFEINPLSKSSIDRAGLLNPDIEITLPLSSKDCLLISHQKTKGGMYSTSGKKGCLQLNHRVLLSMQDIIITHSKDFTRDEEQLEAWINDNLSKRNESQ